MEIATATKQQLAALLAEPAKVTAEHAPMLAGLVAEFPYYQPLHLLLAKAELAEGKKDHLSAAALYNGGNLLYKAIHHPEKLVVKNMQLVDLHNHAQVTAEKSLPIIDEQETFDEIIEVGSFGHDADEQEVFEEIGEFVPVEVADKSIQPEEEVFEEIAEMGTTPVPPMQEKESIAPDQSADEFSADDLALENIVATDFFAFEKSFTSEPTADDDVPQPEEYDQEAEAQTVSKYNDDKLPYTFLWWLTKTRKEHEQIFQPYVTPKSPVEKPQSELQQQYVEHIFHLQTPFDMENGTAPTADRPVHHKGDEIIESFIKNEPQIRAPKAEQLNNENKAKKSAEDHNDLVSETLASIYIEQMLYHKAIETYEKLSLKFPEKSRYFADLIQSLEKKI